MHGKRYKVKGVGPIPKKQFDAARVREAWNAKPSQSLGGDSGFLTQHSRADTMMCQMQSDFNRCVDPRAERRQQVAERRQPVSWGAAGTRRRRGFKGRNYRTGQYGRRTMSNNSIVESGERLSRVPAWHEQIRPVSGKEFRPKSGMSTAGSTAGSGNGWAGGTRSRPASSGGQTLVRVEYGTPVARLGSGGGMMGSKKWKPSSMQRTLDSDGGQTRRQQASSR
jgi:hypothetical protein